MLVVGTIYYYCKQSVNLREKKQKRNERVVCAHSGFCFTMYRTISFSILLVTSLCNFRNISKLQLKRRRGTAKFVLIGEVCNAICTRNH